MRELVMKKCNKCGAVIQILNNDSIIKCCGEDMQELRANSVDAAFEKHVPMVEIDGDILNVKVNHVMEDEHYIEWICYVTDNNVTFTYFKPGDNPKAQYKYEKNTLVYAYCNKHELWSTLVK